MARIAYPAIRASFLPIFRDLFSQLIGFVLEGMLPQG